MKRIGVSDREVNLKVGYSSAGFVNSYISSETVFWGFFLFYHFIVSALFALLPVWCTLHVIACVNGLFIVDSSGVHFSHFCSFRFYLIFFYSHVCMRAFARIIFALCSCSSFHCRLSSSRLAVESMHLEYMAKGE